MLQSLAFLSLFTRAQTVGAFSGFEILVKLGPTLPQAWRSDHQHGVRSVERAIGTFSGFRGHQSLVRAGQRAAHTRQ